MGLVPHVGSAPHGVPLSVEVDDAAPAVLDLAADGLEVRGRPLVRRRLRTSPAGILAAVADLGVLAVYLASFRQQQAGILVLLWAVTVLLFHGGGLYRVRLNPSLLDDVPRIVTRLGVAAALVGVLLVRLSGADAIDGFAAAVVTGLVGHVAGRWMGQVVAVRLHRAGRGIRRAVLVGSGDVSRKVAEVLSAERDYGVRVVGYVDDLAPQGSLVVQRDTDAAGWVRLGPVRDLAALVRSADADLVLIGYGRFRDRSLVDVLRHSHRWPDVYVIQRLFEVGRPGAMADRVGPIPLRPLPVCRTSGLRWAVKRGVDVGVATVALATLAPVMLLVALAVRLEGGPGVIFRQVRVGRGGRHFEILKFRSMAPATPSESEQRWSVADDQRIGPVGRFIRRTSLDELPQLVNVLRGDMTLVGPRPERPHFVEIFGADVPHYRHRHRVPVGLTGLAQVNGLRGDSSIDDRASFDNLYIENHSLWLDLTVMVRTVRQVVTGSGR